MPHIHPGIGMKKRLFAVPVIGRDKNVEFGHIKGGQAQSAQDNKDDDGDDQGRTGLIAAAGTDWPATKSVEARQVIPAKAGIQCFWHV